MPALSPTMTEGNIARWQVKEGDSYSAGDVLLEIETDKATMDVEAQDDGILVKITAPDESKGVKVGKRIAVMAEPGDDVGNLEMPKEEAQPDKSSPKQEAAGGADEAESKTSSSKAPQSDHSEDAPTEEQAKPQSQPEAKHQSSQGQSRKYPHYPSVQHLLHANHLSDADAAKIPASGPNGRLLKGDVLAHLGRINKDYPAEASARMSKLSHLDLSNIQLASPTPKPTADSKSKAEDPAAQPQLPKETQLALPISLAAVRAMQQRLQDSLDISLPLGTFIARASDLANEDLPAGKPRQPTSQQLFDAVLGLPSAAAPKASRGRFVPQVTALGPTRAPTPRAQGKRDIIDVLAGPRLATAPRAPKAVTPGAAEVADAMRRNVFSVSAKPGEERRAMAYLERMKVALEKNPGRLVL